MCGGMWLQGRASTVKLSVMGSSIATSSDATSLTTFLSSVVVASLLSESNSFSVAKLVF